MDITTQLQLIALVFVIGFGIVTVQSIIIARLIRSTSGWLQSGAFALIGLLQAWNFIRLSNAMMLAQNKGTLPASLDRSQWLRVGVVMLAILLLIAGYHKMRWDLKRLGI